MNSAKSSRSSEREEEDDGSWAWGMVAGVAAEGGFGLLVCAPRVIMIQVGREPGKRSGQHVGADAVVKRWLRTAYGTDVLCSFLSGKRPERKKWRAAQVSDCDATSKMSEVKISEPSPLSLAHPLGHLIQPQEEILLLGCRSDDVEGPQ